MYQYNVRDVVIFKFLMFLFLLFRSFLYGAILDRPKNTALGGGGGKNPKQQAPQSKYLIFNCKD